MRYRQIGEKESKERKMNMHSWKDRGCKGDKGRREIKREERGKEMEFSFIKS